MLNKQEKENLEKLYQLAWKRIDDLIIHHPTQKIELMLARERKNTILEICVMFGVDGISDKI
jgi:hypothetical protein